MQSPREQQAPAASPVPNPSGRRWLWLLVGAFVVFGIIAGACRYQQQRDRLLSFIPLDTLAYIHVRTAVWPESPFRLTDLPVPSWYEPLNQQFGFADGTLETSLLPNLQQASLVLLPDPSLPGVEPALLVRLQPRLLGVAPADAARQRAVAFITGQAHYSQLAADVYVIARRQSSLERFGFVSSKAEFSLVQRFNRQPLSLDTVSAWLDLTNLSSYFDQSSVALGLLGQSPHDQLYLSASPEGGLWRFELRGAGDGSKTDGQPPLLTFLPDDFTFFDSDFSVVDFLSRLAATDQAFSDALRQTKDGLQLNQGIDGRAVVESFRQSVSLIIGPAGQGSWLSFSVALVVEPAARLADFESLVSVFLAQRLPKSVQHRLPDGSSVTQLQALSKSFAWQDYPVGDRTGRFVSAPAVGFTLAYLPQDRYTVIATATSTLAAVSQPTGRSINELLKPCGAKAKDHFFIMNTSVNQPAFFKNWPKGTIIGIEYPDRVRGCFYQ